MKICRGCGVGRMIEEVRVIDHGHYNTEQDLSAVVYRKPRAMLFKGKVASPIRADVCGSCGLVELYAAMPAAPLAASEDKPVPPEDPPPPEDLCLRCGGPLPEEALVCRSCGWTYTGESAPR